VARYLVPLGIFLVIVVFLGVGLGLNPRQVPSPLIDRPAPTFDLPQLHATDQRISPESLRGQVWLLNVWASWCVSCRQEHPVLVDLAKTGTVPIYGLNYKDQRDEALRWITAFTACPRPM
jgi:cytochrome c biogenesis protein CcmG/thiol:disulfide interchange protein DsbE